MTLPTHSTHGLSGMTDPERHGVSPRDARPAVRPSVIRPPLVRGMNAPRALDLRFSATLPTLAPASPARRAALG